MNGREAYPGLAGSNAADHDFELGLKQVARIFDVRDVIRFHGFLLVCWTSAKFSFSWTPVPSAGFMRLLSESSAGPRFVTPITSTGRLYDGCHVWAIDLEFAMPIRSRKLRSLRGTRGHFREVPDPMTGKQALMIDRYALGVTLQRLFGGASERSSRYGKRLPAVPVSSGPNVARIIKALRDKQPERRPSAGQALECLVQSKP